MNLLDLARKARKVIAGEQTTPAEIWHLTKAFLRGMFYALWYRLTRRNVVIRLPFMAYAPVRILGKGSVFIDEGCSVFASVFRGLTIMTMSKDASVRIGKGCDLGGLTIRCRNSVTLGDKVMTAVSLVQDTMVVHGRDIGMQNPCKVDGKPVTIGDNAWLGSFSAVLAGSSIGEGCVLSVGSCVLDQSTPGYTLLVGSPIRRPMRIDRLIGLKGNA